MIYDGASYADSAWGGKKQKKGRRRGLVLDSLEAASTLDEMKNWRPRFF